MTNTTLTDNNIELSGEYHADCNTLIDKLQSVQLQNSALKQLVTALIPQMQAQLKGYKDLFPSKTTNKLCDDLLNLINSMKQLSS